MKQNNKYDTRPPTFGKMKLKLYQSQSKNKTIIAVGNKQQ